MASFPFACHTEKTLVEAIHRLAGESSTCRVAVAFCGKSAHRFFPAAPAKRPHDLRIVVDASKLTVRRGLTNPHGVMRLMGLTSEVRSLPALHAKVFIFDERAAIVGSANMSAHSIERQYQMGLEVTEPAIVHQLVAWFDKIVWPKSKQMTREDVSRLQGLWKPFHGGQGAKRGHGKLPQWHGTLPEPPHAPSDFMIGVSRAEIRRLLLKFEATRCPYHPDGSISCAEAAVKTEQRYASLSTRLRSLWHRRATWGKEELGQLFDLAFENGRAAKIKKPSFVGQKPEYVRNSLAFLFEGAGDPYSRFEKLLASDGPYKLYGLGKAGLAFLMHLWNPSEFAVINGPVDKALKSLGVRFKRALLHSEGHAFRNRTAAVRELARLTGLESFGRTDHFLDAIGKGHIK